MFKKNFIIYFDWEGWGWRLYKPLLTVCEKSRFD